MNALDTALYSKLTADSDAGGVSALATGGIHQIIAPQDAGFPRVHFQALLNTPDYTFTQLAYDFIFYQFMAFAKDENTEGVATAGQIAERVRALLTDATITVTGKTVVYTRFERSIPPLAIKDDVSGNFIYQKGCIFKFILVNS